MAEFKPSQANFLARLPNSYEHRQYFTNIMIKSKTPMNIMVPIIGKICFWHAMVKNRYTAYDIDFTRCELDWEKLFKDDVERICFQYILMNPTFSETNAAELLQYILPDYKENIIIDILGTCTDKSKFVLYDGGYGGESGYCYRGDSLGDHISTFIPDLLHIFGEKDTYRRWAIAIPDSTKFEEFDKMFMFQNNGPLTGTICDGLYHPHEIEYIKHSLNTVNNDDVMAFGGIKLCEAVYLHADETLLSVYESDVDSDHAYNYNHCTSFTVDHDIPECVKNNVTLLPMFSKASADDIIECIARQPKLFDSDDENFLYRDDINIECDIIDEELVGVHFYGPNSHAYLKNEDGVSGFEYLLKQHKISVDKYPNAAFKFTNMGFGINILQCDKNRYNFGRCDSIYAVKKRREWVKCRVRQDIKIMAVLQRFMLTDLATVTFQYYL